MCPTQQQVHLKHLSCGFEHPKCEVLCGDGLAFLKDKENAYGRERERERERVQRSSYLI